MPTFVSILKENESDMQALFSKLARDIGGVLIRSADGDGKIPVERKTRVISQALPLVTNLFLGRSGDGDPAPFLESDGRVIPLSPYMFTLWKHVNEATRLGVQIHADIMTKALKNEPEILAVLKSAPGNPFSAARARVAEYVWRPNILAEYEPLHLFVNKDGTPYNLSDRIWKNARETRAAIDKFISQGIAAGQSALEISKGLEKFLDPRRLKKRTMKPYGARFMPPGGASYDAMRLARTEITAAHTRAGLMSAQMNPFVESYRVRLSGRHKCCDNCDDVVAAGPYKLNDLNNLPPLHPHCMCAVLWDLVKDKKQVIDDLRQNITAGTSPLALLKGPLVIDSFIELLLGRALPGVDLGTDFIVNRALDKALDTVKGEDKQLELFDDN